MTDSPNLVLPYIDVGQAQKEVTHNTAIALLDAVVQLSVIAIQGAPPGAPVDGQRWIVGAAPTGAWAGQADKVALWLSGWIFITPRLGWQAYLQATNALLIWTGAAWTDTAFLITSSYTGLRSRDGADRIRAGRLATDNRILIDLYDAAGGSSVTVRDSAGADMVKLDSDGNMDFQGEVRRNGVKLLGARDTGWTAFTGTASKGGFATSTVTLPQLAQVVKALQDALTAAGIVGA
jgi:hypothetical protein